MVWQIVLWVWRLLDGAKWFADCICTVLLIVLRFVCLRCKPAIMLVDECVCHYWNVCRNGGICSVVCRFVYRLFWLVLSRRKGIFCVQKFWLRLKPCRIRLAGGFSTFFVTYAPLWKPLSEKRNTLKVLSRRSEQLNVLLNMVSNRKDVSDKVIKSGINRIIDVIKTEIESCKSAIQSLIDSDKELSHNQQLLQTISGVGKTTAAW